MYLVLSRHITSWIKRSDIINTGYIFCEILFFKRPQLVVSNVLIYVQLQTKVSPFLLPFVFVKCSIGMIYLGGVRQIYAFVLVYQHANATVYIVR